MPNEKTGSLTVREYIEALEKLAKEHGDDTIVMEMYDGGFFWEYRNLPTYNETFGMILVGGMS